MSKFQSSWFLLILSTYTLIWENLKKRSILLFIKLYTFVDVKYCVEYSDFLGRGGSKWQNKQPQNYTSHWKTKSQFDGYPVVSIADCSIEVCVHREIQ